MQYYFYRNGSNNKKYPYLIDVQSDLIDLLTTRIVIPLVHASQAQTRLPERICPIVEVEGEEFIVMTHEMASVDASVLREEVGNAMAWRTEIKAAIDFVFDGF
ncbi:CcdB family protein [Buttiauxella noackiae]|uniref:CcdB family protein n=1 Tax=Buttiauxella noackiae TaxID=82992 RepID=UPI0005578319|nr:CcdB family protein [Buttiauxella noackiae]